MSIISNNAGSIKPHESLTGFATEKASKYLMVNKEDTGAKKNAKLAVGSAAFLGLALVGLVETFVRNLLAIFIKVGHFFTPKEYSEKFDKKVMYPVYEQAGVTTASTLDAASKIATNFMSNENRDKARNAIDNSTAKVYNSNFMRSALDFHIDSFIGKEPSPETS